ncbi:MAG: hypothetical protein IIX06_06730, partial [Bacteroidales bacterium]|nr:hypothetical protein [Bacteroidales bacterium]
GIRGREPKEISFKNLAGIIQARLEEIFDLVNFEIQKVNSEHKLIAGIVLTGGGAMMKHIRQLAEFKTGLEVRLGYPNEYLANETADDLASPLYSTGIGLVIEGIAKYENDLKKGKYETGGNSAVKGGNVNDDESKGGGEENGGSTTKAGGFTFSDIITSISKIFKSENLDKDITE